MAELSVIATFISATKEKQADIAKAAMLSPKHELFTLGEAAGRYQGLQMALDLLDDILRDNHEKESSS